MAFSSFFVVHVLIAASSFLFMFSCLWFLSLQRDLERELEEATVTSQAQQMAQSGDDVDDVLTASTVL